MAMVVVGLGELKEVVDMEGVRVVVGLGEEMGAEVMVEVKEVVETEGVRVEVMVVVDLEVETAEVAKGADSEVVVTVVEVVKVVEKVVV